MPRVCTPKSNVILEEEMRQFHVEEINVKWRPRCCASYFGGPAFDYWTGCRIPW